MGAEPYHHVADHVPVFTQLLASPGEGGMLIVCLRERHSFENGRRTGGKIGHLAP
jgi:hypothetical protein